MSERIPMAIREVGERDRAFVLSSYLRSFRDEPPNVLMGNEVYFRVLSPRAESIAGGVVHIAHTPGDPDQILGWLCSGSDPTRVRYAYTKHPFRRFGVFDRLLAHVHPTGGPIVATHTGRMFDFLKIRYSLIFDPTGEP